MGYEIMNKDTVEVLDGQTAKTESEPTAITLEETEKESKPTDITPKEVEEIKTEVAHTCKSKCESCEYDYTERSTV